MSEIHEDQWRAELERLAAADALAETEGGDDGDGALLELTAADPLVGGLVLAESVAAAERVKAGVEEAEPVLRADCVGWPVTDVVAVTLWPFAPAMVSV